MEASTAVFKKIRKAIGRQGQRPAVLSLSRKEETGPTASGLQINEPDEVLLWLVRREQAPDPAFLAYGYGMDPAANLIDQEGLAAPAFGPLRLPPRPPAPAGR